MRQVGPPANPPDGEQVLEVLSLPVEDAAVDLAGHDPVDGDVVRLAEAVGLLDDAG